MSHHRLTGAPHPDRVCDRCGEYVNVHWEIALDGRSRQRYVHVSRTGARIDRRHPATLDGRTEP